MASLYEGLRRSICARRLISYFSAPSSLSLAYLGKGEAVRHADALVSQKNRPAFHQRVSEGAGESSEVGHEGSAKEDIAGEVHFMVENVLGSCCPTFLPGP